MSRRRTWLLLGVLAAAVAAIVLATSGGDEPRRAAGASVDAGKPRSDRPASRTGGPASERRERERRLARERPRLTDAQAIERVRRMTPYVDRGSGRGRLVALTFDDGPGPTTPALLAELRRLRVPATFFQVGDLVDANPALASATREEPFTVGSHTVSHPYLSRLPLGAQQREIEGGAAAIEASGGRYPKLFRPPYGHWNDDTLRALRRNRMLMVFWTVSSRDWLISDPEALAARVVSRVRPGAIVLMHDFGGATREPTLRAVPLIVSRLRRQGYRFVTVPRLLRDAPPERRPPRPPMPYPL